MILNVPRFNFISVWRVAGGETDHEHRDLAGSSLRRQVFVAASCCAKRPRPTSGWFFASCARLPSRPSMEACALPSRPPDLPWQCSYNRRLSRPTDDLYPHGLADLRFAEKTAGISLNPRGTAITAGISLEVGNALQEFVHPGAARPIASQRLCRGGASLCVDLLCRIPKSAQCKRASNKHEQHQRDNNLQTVFDFFPPAAG